MNQYTAIDLFSGAGGLHLGFENAGFEIKLCIDNNDLVEKTHRRNFPNIPMINRDINQVPTSEIKEYLADGSVDIIIGGPPLQAEISFMNKLGLVRSNNAGRPAYRVGTGLCIDWPQVETSLQFFNNL